MQQQPVEYALIADLEFETICGLHIARVAFLNGWRACVVRHISGGFDITWADDAQTFNFNTDRAAENLNLYQANIKLREIAEF